MDQVKALLADAARAALTAGVAYIAAQWQAVDLPADVKTIVALLAVALWNRFVKR
jgi:hypothetical protein